jgi:hypothetical protein
MGAMIMDFPGTVKVGEWETPQLGSKEMLVAPTRR